MTVKIHNIRFDHMLTAEFKIHKTLGTKNLPHEVFCIGSGVAHRFGEDKEFGVELLVHLGFNFYYFL
jgi:hypothetical protein